MKITKKTLFLVMIVCLVSVQFVSAGAEGESGSSGPSIGMTFDEPVTLVQQTWFPTQGVQDEQMAIWNKKFPNITVERQTFSYADHITTLKTAFSAGAKAGPGIAAYQPGGMIADYTQFLEPLAPWAEAEWGPDWQDQFVGAANEQVEWTGKEYYMLPQGMSFTGLWANKRLLDKYGLALPENLDDLKKIRDTLSKDDLITLGIGLKNDWPAQDLFFIILDDYAPGLFYEAEAGNASMDDPRVVEALEMYKYLLDSEIINPGAYGSAHYMDLLEPFQQGKAALLLNGHWHISSVFLNNLNISDSQVGGFVPLVFPDLNGNGKNPRAQISMGGGFGINNSLSDYEKAAAWEFVKFLVTGEGQQIIIDAFSHISAYTAMSPAAASLRKTLDVWTGAPESMVDEFKASNQWYVDNADSNTQGPREPQGAETKAAIYELLANVALGEQTPEEAAKYLAEVMEAEQK